LTKLVQSQLYGVKAHDPWTAVTAIVGITAIALLARYAPGRRATKIHPMGGIAVRVGLERVRPLPNADVR